MYFSNQIVLSFLFPSLTSSLDDNVETANVVVDIEEPSRLKTPPVTCRSSFGAFTRKGFAWGGPSLWDTPDDCNETIEKKWSQWKKVITKVGNLTEGEGFVLLTSLALLALLKSKYCGKKWVGPTWLPVEDLYLNLYIVQLTQTLVLAHVLYSASLHNIVKYLKPNIVYKHFSHKNIE